MAFTPLSQSSNFKPLKPKVDNSVGALMMSGNVLENIRKGQAQQNVEATKGFAKGALESFAGAGAQNAGPVGAAMKSHAGGFFDSLEQVVKPTNPAQAYGKGSELVAELGAGTAAASNEIKNVANTVKGSAQKLMDRSSHIIKPQPKPLEAVGQVLQKTKSPVTPKDMESFRHVDTEGVKTYDELGKQVDKSIGRMSEDVDSVLSVDETKHPMASLETQTTSNGGTTVKRNFVQNALDHLKELYEKTADDAGKADVEDLIKTANEQGLTRKEVNDVSRLYNEEFGAKAFSKGPEQTPLTSVNAQMYENIRTGLKDVARQGITGDVAKETDNAISSLYNVKKLVTKNAEAVQKLRQKIEERGLVAKVGYKAVKFFDTITGGTVRGVMDGLLNRGTGLKTLNALDLEERLSRNLNIIKKALEDGTDEGITSALKELDDLPKAPAGETGQPKITDSTQFERNPALTPEGKLVEERAIQKVLANEDQILADHTKKYGKVVNTDDFRPVFKDIGYKGSNSADVHEPASYLSKRARAEALKNGGDYALTLAGGSGTGKTSATKVVLKPLIDKAAMIMDTNLSKLETAHQWIKEVEAADKKFAGGFVYRQPLESFDATILRGLTNPDEMGRMVPASETAKNHIGSWNVVQELVKEGRKFRFVDNANGIGKARLTTLKDLQEKIKYPSVKELTKQFQARLDEIYKNGIKNPETGEILHLTPEQYQAIHS